MSPHRIELYEVSPDELRALDLRAVAVNTPGAVAYQGTAAGSAVEVLDADGCYVVASNADAEWIDAPSAEAAVLATLLPTYHVTSVRNDGVYGHGTRHCDESGCAGDEVYLGDARDDVSPGDEVTKDGERVWVE